MYKVLSHRCPPSALNEVPDILEYRPRAAFLPRLGESVRECIRKVLEVDLPVRFRLQISASSSNFTLTLIWPSYKTYSGITEKWAKLNLCTFRRIVKEQFPCHHVTYLMYRKNKVSEILIIDFNWEALARRALCSKVNIRQHSTGRQSGGPAYQSIADQPAYLPPVKRCQTFTIWWF